MTANSFQQQVFLECCQAVVPRIKLIPGVVKCPVNPSCLRKYRFSWCANALVKDEKRYHCTECGFCLGKREVHCQVCNQCHHIRMQCDQISVPGDEHQVIGGQSSKVLPLLQEDIVSSTDSVFQDSAVSLKGGTIPGTLEDITDENVFLAAEVTSSQEAIISNVVNHEVVVSEVDDMWDIEVPQFTDDQCCAGCQPRLANENDGFKATEGASTASSVALASLPSSPASPIRIASSSVASTVRPTNALSTAMTTMQASSRTDRMLVENENDIDKLDLANGNDASTVAFEDPVDLDCEEIFEEFFDADEQSGKDGGYAKDKSDATAVLNIVSVSPDEALADCPSILDSVRTSVSVVIGQDSERNCKKSTIKRKLLQRQRRRNMHSERDVYVLKNKPFGQLQKTFTRSNGRPVLKKLLCPRKPFRPSVQFVSDVKTGLDDVTNTLYDHDFRGIYSSKYSPDDLHLGKLPMDEVCPNETASPRFMGNLTDLKSRNLKEKDPAPRSRQTDELEIMSLCDPEIPASVYEDYDSCVDPFPHGLNEGDMFSFNDGLEVGKVPATSDIFKDSLSPNFLTLPNCDQTDSSQKLFNIHLDL